MRAVFLALVAANILFLAWARWIDGPRESSAPDSLARLPRLQLITEPAPGSKPTALDAPATGQLEQVTQRTPLRLSDPTQTCTSVGPFNDITTKH